MKRKPYTVQEKEILLSSKAIVKVSNSSATYSSELKIFAVKEYLNGKIPIQIFLEADVNIDILGHEQPHKCLLRWRRKYHQEGEESLLKKCRGLNSTGRPSTKELSVKILQQVRFWHTMSQNTSLCHWFWILLKSYKQK